MRKQVLEDTCRDCGRPLSDIICAGLTAICWVCQERAACEDEVPAPEY